MSHKLLLGMADLAARAESAGLAIFEFSYSERIYGSWSLTLGSVHKRLQFCWEGKEFYLTCAVSECNDIGETPEWVFIPNDVNGSPTTVSEIIEFAWSMTNEQFAL